MSQLTKGQLQGENAASFPNNNTNFITPALLREFNTDMIDSLALQSQVDAVSSSVNGLLVSSSKYATTGSNRFNGNQTISGSYYLDIGSTRIRDVENGITVFDSTGGLQVRNYGSNDLQLEQNAVADLTITNQLLDIHLYTPSGAIFLNDVDFEQYSASVDSRLNNAQGVQGATGIQGASGTNGTNGAQGIQGLQGIQGTQGIQGAFGQTGNAGIQGIQGITGVQGIIGTTGASGSQGVQGITGAGTQGATGAQGTAGAGTSISVQDEGSILGNATSFNFNGAGVTASVSAGTASITIAGGGGTINTGSFITTGSVGQLQAIKGTLGVSDITTLSTGSTPSTLNSSTGTLLIFLYDDINFGPNPSIGTISVGWTMSGSGITDGTVTSAGYGDTGYEVNITSGNVVSGSSYIGTGPFVKGLIITGSVFSDSEIKTPAGFTISNQDGTGVPYGAITFNAVGLDPADIDTSVYFDGGANLRRLQLGLSSYTAMYAGQTVPTIQGGANYNAGFGSSNVSITFFSSSIQNWKPTEFKAPVNITGSLSVSGSTNFRELTGSLATFSASVSTRINSGGGGVGAAYLYATQSFTGTNTFSAPLTASQNIKLTGGGNIQFPTLTYGTSSYEPQVNGQGFTLYQSQGQPYAFSSLLEAGQLNTYSGSQFMYGLQTNGSGQSQFGGSTYYALASGSYTSSVGPGSLIPGLSVMGNNAGGFEINDFKAPSIFEKSVFVNGGIFISGSPQPKWGGALNIDQSNGAYAAKITGSVSITGSLSVNGNSVATLASNTFTQTQIVSSSIYIAPNNNTNQLYLPSGSNKQTGTFVLNGGNPGTATISNSNVTANSLIFLTKQSNANSGNGTVSVTSKGSGTFSVTSNHNGDADEVAFMIINPS